MGEGFGITSQWLFKCANGTIITCWYHCVYLRDQISADWRSPNHDPLCWEEKVLIAEPQCPPLVPVSLISLVAAVSGPPPSVCTCVFVRVTQGQQISGRVCWQTGKAWHKSTHSVHAPTTSTQARCKHAAFAGALLCGCLCGCLGFVCVR